VPSGIDARMNDHAPRDLVIALSLLPFLTPNRTRLLLEYFDPVYAACNASSRLLQGLLSVTPEQADEVRNPLTKEERIETLRHSVVTLLDDDYPPQQREVSREMKRQRRVRQLAQQRRIVVVEECHHAVAQSFDTLLLC
jgi:hypothetical protein